MDVKENELAARVLEVELEEMLLMAYISAKVSRLKWTSYENISVWRRDCSDSNNTIRRRIF